MIEPEHDLIAIGSGGSYAQAAALAFTQGTELPARDIVERSLNIAADICIYTQPQSDDRGAVAFMSQMTPREIVEEIGQAHRRPEGGEAGGCHRLAQSVAPATGRREPASRNHPEKHPHDRSHGVGKTEIARRLARLAKAPFIKVEATKFTEVGYVGREVDSIVRDLVEISVKMTREEEMAKVRHRAADAAEDRVLDALLPRAQAGFTGDATPRDGDTRQRFRKMLREHELDDREIEIEVRATAVASRSWRRRAWRK